ncbi:complement component C8 gamma chain [Xenopus laevis]|uniref:Complement component C8 gamma chain n=1 Tax=Xenopus laevis TaxID=8355 RepID=A0A8J0TQL1_XENLA|nr:complement component C8 gamma chain [Xenopus laevis]
MKHLGATLVSLLLLLSTPTALGQRQKKPSPPNPIDKIEATGNFMANRFAGKWYLLSVASECNYLKLHNHRAEATITQVTASKKPKAGDTLTVSTFRKMDGICWEIKHEYTENKQKGKFLLRARGYGGPVDMVVGETDYNSYAILYYQRQRKLSMKLYGRRTDLSNDIFSRFDELVAKQGMGLGSLYAFPSYGFCESADEFHILDEVPE